MASPGPSLPRLAAWVPWPATAAFAIGEAGGYLLPLAIGPMTLTYGISESAAGFVVALQLGAFSFAAIALAARLGRLSPRCTALAAVGLIATGNLLSAAIASPVALLAGRALAGLGEGTAEAVGTRLIARTLDPDRAFARALLVVVSLVLVFFQVLPALVAGGGARPLFAGMAVAPLLAVPLLLGMPTATDPAATPGARPPDALQVRFTLPAIAVCVALMLYSISANAAWFYLERVASRAGMSPAVYGRLVAISGVIALAGPLFAQWLGLRAGRVVPLTLASVIVAAGGWLVTHASTPLPFIAGLASSSAALLFGVPYFMGLAAELDPTGAVAAAARGFNGAGSTLAPAVAAVVLMASGRYQGIGWTSIVTAALSLTLVLAVIVRRYRTVRPVR